MVTRSPGGMPHPAPSMSDAEQTLTSIERNLRSLDRSPDAAPIILELEQVVADIRQALESVPS